MNIVEKLRLMQTDHIPELGEAIAEIEHLRREAHAWSKACEDATTKLYKLSTHHPRLEVRYWTGKYWEPLYGARFHEVLNALDLTPNAKSEPTAPLLAQVGSTDGLCGAVSPAPTF